MPCVFSAFRPSDVREANVGGDDDEKYEDDDFSIAEVLPAPCDSDRMFGMCFPNVNVERVFLYFLLATPPFSIFSFFATPRGALTRG